MPISIKNPETEELARKLAQFTGESITDAVRTAVSERYERVRRERSGRSLADELNEIALSCARLPVISNMTDDEILGYDEFGIPTK
jgi:antitoxin VapB